MNTPPPTPTGLRLCILAFGLAATLALSACAAIGEGQSASDDPDDCGSTASCEEPGRLAPQVRLDTDAILAGVAHARARLGLQEDATP